MKNNSRRNTEENLLSVRQCGKIPDRMQAELGQTGQEAGLSGLFTAKKSFLMQP